MLIDLLDWSDHLMVRAIGSRDAGVSLMGSSGVRPVRPASSAMSSFEPVHRASLSDQVATSIRKAILSGPMSPGDRLPPERELAVQFQVNRSSVREALQRLVAWGLVEVRHGGGVTVRDFMATVGMEVLPWVLAPGGCVDSSLMRDLIEVRADLLGLTADLAARRASAVDRSELAARLDSLAQARGVSNIQDADFAFFEALTRASRNRVLWLQTTMIGRVYAENRAVFEALYPHDRIDTTAHQATVDAIEAGDSVTARQAMHAYGMSALGVFDVAPPREGDHS